MSHEKDPSTKALEAEAALALSVQRLLEVILLGSDQAIIQDARADYHWALKNLKKSGSSLGQAIVNHMEDK